MSHHSRSSMMLLGSMLVVGLFGLALVPPSEAADLARGEKVYTLMCKKCHGAEGKGDGDKAAELKKKPADYTNAGFLNKFSDDDLKKIVLDGKDEMPAYKKKIRTAEDLENVISYIKTFAK